ncbi:AMP-binding protein [Nonomuraea sp. CA-143628]|uniref:AMP-binding protein n=1 Tax=Nonomuraea sp. CA-143628 TaxID=3239997 RepID=UPI003D9003FE
MPEALIERVARWAREIPYAPAYTFVDHLGDGSRETLTWARADLKARALAVRLREVAGPGDRVAILAPQGLPYVVAMLGALYAGIVAVPLFAPDLPGHAERLSRAYSDAEPVAVLTTTAALPGVRDFAAGVPVIAVDTVSDLLADEWEPVPIGPGELAYLQYTSGSTRAPAGVEITHGNLEANAAQLWELFRAKPRTSVAALWLPLFHDMGLVATIALPMVGGNQVAFMDPVAFVMHPVRWLRLLSEFDDVYTGGPNFAYEYTAARVGAADKEGLDLSGVRVMLNGAEPVRPGTVEAFNAAFGGLLYVTGRIKDLIIADGRNHYPQDIEVTVQEAHRAVCRDHVAAFSVPGEETERLVVVAERSRGGASADPAEVAARVRAAVRKFHDLSVHDFVLTGTGAVPRTTSGKIARRACLRAYLEGALV